MELSLNDLIKTRMPVLIKNDFKTEFEQLEDEEYRILVTNVDLRYGNYYEITVDFSETDPDNAFFGVQLFDDAGTVYWADQQDLSADDDLHGTMNVDFSHVKEKAENATLLLYFAKESKNSISDIRLSLYDYIVGADSLTNIVRAAGFIVMAVIATVFFYSICLAYKQNKKKTGTDISIISISA